MNKIDEKTSLAIAADVQAAIDSAEQRRFVELSANEIAREYDVHPQTVTAIIARMGLVWDGFGWYIPAVGE